MAGLTVLFIITALLATALHIGSVVLKKKTAEILTYVNLGLHIALIFELMALKASFELMTLVFMISLFVYLAASFISYKIRRKEKTEDDV